jgi:hypothetical protein
MPRPKAASARVRVVRLTCLFVLGLVGGACKDNPAAKPAEVATPGSATPAPTPPPRGPVPTLDADKLFDAETRDATWANSAEQSIAAVAPQLTDVTCRRMQCRATLSAATGPELIEATDKLQADESLRGIEGLQSIKLTQPVERDGKIVMRLYVRFNRD